MSVRHKTKAKAKAKGVKASGKSGQANRGSKATTVAPKAKRAARKVKPMWKKTQAPRVAKKPVVEVKPKPVIAPEGRYSDKPVEVKPVEQAPVTGSWRCVWCGLINEEVDARTCSQCGQLR
jgi:formylmethanofuran dehydrogenase subunit E